MKKILFIGVLVLGLASCSDFLDTDEGTKISNDKLFSTIQGVEEALNGVYYVMRSSRYYGLNMMIVADVKGGNLKPKDLTFINPYSLYFVPAFRFNHNVEGDEDYMSDCYKHIYTIITAANNVIENIEYAVDATEEQKLQAVAEAKAIRALAHFDLTRLYAQPYNYTANAQHIGIPYLLKNIAWNELATRDMLYDNYENIITDLLFAEDNLGTAIGLKGANYSKAYMSKLVAQALLARVYLYKNDWNKAKEYATKVIESGNVTILDNNEILDSYENQAPTSEDIFVIDNTGVSGTAHLSHTMGISEDRASLFLLPTDDIINLYQEGDVRGELFDQQLGKTLTTKWTEISGSDNCAPIIRLAEMYLIRAEASLNLPVSDEVQCRADLDVIRKRANPDAANLQLSGLALREELFNERRRELAFEGHLFFDIVRMGRDLRRVDYSGKEDEANIDYPSDLFVLPIPEYAMEYNNKMIQNPGY